MFQWERLFYHLWVLSSIRKWEFCVAFDTKCELKKVPFGTREKNLLSISTKPVN